jgi:hypothetical protein
MRIVQKKISDKTSKGYRLKVSTHRLIDKMQELLQCNQDEVITVACIKYYTELKANINNGKKGK